MRNLPVKSILSCLTFAALLVACQSKDHQLNAAESNAITDNVRHMADNIEKDVSAKGSTAWLNYFENDPGFFMVSNGAVVFQNYEDGRSKIIKSVSRLFSKIALNWKDYKIDPLSSTYASFGADFKENIVLVNGQKMAISGYVTATVHLNGSQWKIRNMNWAIIAPQQASK